VSVGFSKYSENQNVCGQMLIEVPYVKFNENPLVGIELFHEDRPRDMMKPEFHFANAPEKHERLTMIFSCQ
jgi:hypothetical protein